MAAQTLPRRSDGVVCTDPGTTLGRAGATGARAFHRRVCIYEPKSLLSLGGSQPQTGGELATIPVTF